MRILSGAFWLAAVLIVVALCAWSATVGVRLAPNFEPSPSPSVSPVAAALPPSHGETGGAASAVFLGPWAALGAGVGGLALGVVLGLLWGVWAYGRRLAVEARRLVTAGEFSASVWVAAIRLGKTSDSTEHRAWRKAVLMGLMPKPDAPEGT